MNLFVRLKEVSPWHYVWISILCSELITLLLSTVQGRVWWGGVSRETLIIGAVDSLVVPLIVASMVVYFVKQTADLRKVNEQLQEANRSLQELDSMKSDFISVVSHELRTPLTTIKAFTEILLMKPAMAEQQRTKLLSTMNAEADRLTRLINDLLDLSRIESGAMKWRSDRVALDEVIANALATMGPLFENKRLTATSAVAGPLPHLTGDRDRLVQVMTNLLSNAVKFSRPGGSVHVAARCEGQATKQVVIEVSDTGMGIRPEDMNVIFEKFRRSGDQLTSTIEGSGLGLAITRQIVEHHGGTITVASVLGKGSTFRVCLPIPA